jgi:ApbE superfamily uncharacterized protein (UPF0280 family)
MDHEKDVSIERLSRDPYYTDRSIYRRNISAAGKYSYRLRYKYTDIYITSDRDISGKISQPVITFYSQLENVLSSDKQFGKSITPLSIKKDYPPAVKEMCLSSSIFNVGPMAAVAGAVCDTIAESLKDDCNFLMIENGGDVYIKSSEDIRAGLFTGSRHFPQNINIVISSQAMPCGLCSSSGMMGHSLSLGKSDLVTVMSETSAIADSAATAIANAINSKPDVDKAIKKYSKYEQVRGLIIIKDDRLAIWGDLQLDQKA